MRSDGPEPDDAPVGTSPRVRDQPSLTTSSGRVWLVLGGILSVIALAVLIPLTRLAGGGVAFGGALVIVLLYVAMLITRINASEGRLRLGLLAGLMICIALVALGCVIAVAASEWDSTLSTR